MAVMTTPSPSPHPKRRPATRPALIAAGLAAVVLLVLFAGAPSARAADTGPGYNADLPASFIGAYTFDGANAYCIELAKPSPAGVRTAPLAGGAPLPVEVSSLDAETLARLHWAVATLGASRDPRDTAAVALYVWSTADPRGYAAAGRDDAHYYGLIPADDRAGVRDRLEKLRQNETLVTVHEGPGRGDGAWSWSPRVRVLVTEGRQLLIQAERTEVVGYADGDVSTSSATPTATPSVTPTAAPSPGPTAPATPTTAATPAPTATPGPTIRETVLRPKPHETIRPIPSSTPSAPIGPTPEPTPTPSPAPVPEEPGSAETEVPDEPPIPVPSSDAPEVPSSESPETPTEDPASAPAATPTPAPSASGTPAPTGSPTGSVMASPTPLVTVATPSGSATASPSTAPSASADPLAETGEASGLGTWLLVGGVATALVGAGGWLLTRRNPGRTSDLDW